MKTLFGYLAVATLTATGICTTQSMAHAQKPVEIKYACKVAGYSDWVRIETGSGLGGKVKREAGGGLVTDRVARGEQLRVSIDDKEYTRGCKCSFILEAKVASENSLVFQGDIKIPFNQTFTVSRDAKFDNVFVTVFDPIAPGGKVVRRVPIGSR